MRKLQDSMEACSGRDSNRAVARDVTIVFAPEEPLPVAEPPVLWPCPQRLKQLSARLLSARIKLCSETKLSPPSNFASRPGDAERDESQHRNSVSAVPHSGLPFQIRTP